MMTLFQPTTGQVRVKGITSCTNKVLHPWLKQELSAVLATRPVPASEDDPAVCAKTLSSFLTALAPKRAIVYKDGGHGQSLFKAHGEELLDSILLFIEHTK